MLVVGDIYAGVTSSVKLDEIEKYEKEGHKLYNRLDDGTMVLWFDGEKWLFPKPEPNIQIMPNPSTKILQKISDQLDVLIQNQNGE